MMKFKQIQTLFFFIAATSLLLIFILFINSKTGQLQIRDQSVSLPPTFGKIQTTKVEYKGKQTTASEAGNGKEKILIESTTPLEESEFNEDINSQILLINSQYEDQPSPYAGAVSKISSCEIKMRPQVLKENGLTIISAPTNGRYSFGVCEKNLLTHSADIIFSFEKKTKTGVKIHLHMLNENRANRDQLLSLILQAIGQK